MIAKTFSILSATLFVASSSTVCCLALSSTNSFEQPRSNTIHTPSQSQDTAEHDPDNLSLLLGRRSFVGTAAAALGSSIAVSSFGLPFKAQAAEGTPSASTSSFAQRLDQDKLLLPRPSYPPELNGVDNTYFPSFLAGTWNVTQTLVDVKTPLGLKFAGGPNGDESIARETMAQASQQLQKGVTLQLRYIPTKWGVAEDRLFNTRQRLNAFAGKSVVAAVEYANVGGSNRPSVLAMGGTENDPLQTTVVRFKGPAAQKSFVVSHGGDALPTSSSGTESDVWSGYELQRSIFALTNQNTAPPITTDSELIWQFRNLEDGRHVQGKFRIAGYLNAQSDKLYFDAGKRAVTLQDYTLDMRKVSET